MDTLARATAIFTSRSAGCACVVEALRSEATTVIVAQQQKVVRQNVVMVSLLGVVQVT